MSLVDTIETLKKNGDIHFPFALISIPNVLLVPILNNLKNGSDVKKFLYIQLGDLSKRTTAREELNKIYMKPEETIFEFSSRFRKLMTQAKVNDNSDLAIQSFINAIPRYLTDKLLHLIDSGEINESISEYLTRLQIYETNFYNAKKDKESSAFHYKAKKNNFNLNSKFNNNI